MRLSVGLYPYDRWGSVSALCEAVRLADEIGLDSVTMSEHIVMPLRSGVDPLSVVWYDNCVLASHLAAIAPNIGFTLSAFVVPYRAPVQAAKMISTLDALSGGRLTIVAGAGWSKREFAILGVPFERRGDRTDEYLRAMKELWTAPSPRFEGEFSSFANLAFLPRCVQQPHVPLLIGGSGPRVMRRAIEIGDGWAPMTYDFESLRVGIECIRAGVDERGRSSADLRFLADATMGRPDPARARAFSHVRDVVQSPNLVGGDAGEITELIGRYAGMGVTDVELNRAWDSPKEFMSNLDWLGSTVIPEVQASC